MYPGAASSRLGAYRKRAAAALPEKAAMASIERFDPLRGWLLDLLD
jgi:hypothetical protein